jgi:hypothetical protein
MMTRAQARIPISSRRRLHSEDEEFTVPAAVVAPPGVVPAGSTKTRMERTVGGPTPAVWGLDRPACRFLIRSRCQRSAERSELI